MTPAIAVALTGETGAGEILTALHEQNYFTNKQAIDGESVYETTHSSETSSCRRRGASTRARIAPANRGPRRASSTRRARSTRPRDYCATPRTGRPSRS